MIRNLREKLKSTGFFYIFGSTFVNQVFAFFSGIILVRVLTKGEYGIYSYAYSIINFILLFNGLGATSGLLQVASESKDPRRREAYFGYANRVGIGFDLILAVLIILTGLFVPLKIKGTGAQLMLMAFIPLIQFSMQIKITKMRSEFRTREYALSNSSNALFLFVFSVFGAFLLREKGVILGQYLSYALTVMLITVFVKEKIHFRRDGLSKADEQDFLRFALTAAATTGISQILYTLDVFVVGWVIADETAVAVYKTASTLPTALSFIPAAAAVYLYPYFAKNQDKPEWMIRVFRKVLLLMGVLNFLICGILIAFAPFVISTVFGAQYLDSVPAFRVLTIGYFFSGTFRNITANLLVTQHELAYNFRVALISGAANIVGNILLVMRFGSIGAAYTTVIIMVLTGFANTIRMFHVCRRKMKR